MNRPMQLVGLGLFVTFIVGCGGDELGMTFQVDFPGTPKQMKQEMGEVKIKMWAYEKSNSEVLMVSVNNLPGAPTGAEADVVLQQAAQGQYMGMGGSLAGTSKTQLSGKYPGIETHGSAQVPMAGPVKVKSRIYVVGSKLYQLLAMGGENMIGSPETTKFFDSFKILAE